MKKGFSSILRRETKDIWQRIFLHPFLQELEEGTLPLEKFRYYLLQDYQYLEGFARAIAIALSKAPDSPTLAALSTRLATPIERAFHKRLFQLLEIAEAQATQVKMSPTTRAYTNHLLCTAATGGIGETAAALLPCPWTYHELGARIKALEHPIYSQWARFYSQGFLQESVAAWRGLLDKFAEKAGPSIREAMRQAFLTSSRYEYLFWEMAYKEERWPV